MFEGTTTELIGVWADGRDDAWVVGWQSDGDVGPRRPVIAHWRACRWTTLPLPASARMTRALAVWGSADDDVWIVGQGEDALHFDGYALSVVPLGRGDIELQSLSGTAANDVWAVGPGVLHWDGTTWTEMAVPGVDPEQVFSDVWAVAPNDVYVTNALDVSHFDGALWTTTRAVTDSIAFLLAVWSSGGDAWASGEAAELLRLRAGSWVRESLPGGGFGNALFDIGARNGDLHLVGVNELRIFDGTSFVQVVDAPVPPLVGPLAFYQSVWVSDAQVWVAGFNLGMGGLGDQGVILHRQR
jgi:hypothetical protein